MKKAGMKGKFPTIVMAVMALVLALSLVAVVEPASEAESADLSWSTLVTPSIAIGIYPMVDIVDLELSPNYTSDSTIYASVNDPMKVILGAWIGTLGVVKSNNGGVMWSACTEPQNPVGVPPVAPLQIAVAPDDANFVAATDGATIWVSNDGGGTWANYGTAAAIDPGAGLPVIQCIDVGPSMAGTHPIAVGIDDTAAAVDPNGVYLWGWGSPPSLSWAPQMLAEDTWAVAFSPNYTSDFTIVAVGSPAAATNVHLGDGSLSIAPPGNWDAAAIFGAGWPQALDAIAAATGAHIALPSDFNGLPDGKQVAFVGTTGGTTPDVYRVSNVGALALASGLAGVASLDMVGTIGGSAALMAGDIAPSATLPYANLVYTTDPWSAAPWWSGANKAPTGLTGFAQVALHPDYMTNGEAFCGTGPIGVPGDESALSKTVDSGLTWNQISLIDTDVSVGIADLAPSPDYATDTTLFVATCAATPPSILGAVFDSLWKSTMGGTLWERIDVFPVRGVLSTTNDTAIVRVSPNYGTDKTVYWAETGAAANRIRVSSDGGGFFLTKTVGWAAAAGIRDVAVEDGTTLYLASGAWVGKSTDSASSWPSMGSALAGVGLLALHAGTGDLFGSGTAIIYYVDTSTMTVSIQGQITGEGLGSVQWLAFSDNYASDKTIYAAGTGATGMIWKLAGVGGVMPATMTQLSLVPAPAASGLAVSDDGVLYCADPVPFMPGPPVFGGVLRSVNPEAEPIALGVVPEFLRMTQGFASLPAAVTIAAGGAGFNSLWLADDTVFVRDVANPLMPPFLLDRILVYRDTLLIPPTLSLPADGATAVGTEALTGMYYITLEWEAVEGALGYGLQIDTDPGFGNPIVNIGIQTVGWAPTNPLAFWTAIPINQPATSYITPAGPLALLVPGTEYYWRMRVDNTALGTGSCVGKWSEPWSFTTGPDIAPPAKIIDLEVIDSTHKSMSLSWTAPGDDGNVGTAATYDIRYDTSEITEENWDLATQCAGEPVPQPAGSSESFVVTGLSPETTYYFAMKTADKVPKWSELSNVASGTTQPLIAAIRDLPSYAIIGDSFEVTVTFTATEDECNTIGLTDEADGAHMSVAVDQTWCEPDATLHNATDNKAEYLWWGPYDAGTAFTAVYQVTVDPGTPEGTYTFSGTLECYIAGEGPYTAPIGGEYEIPVVVAPPCSIAGLTGEVACSILPFATVELYKEGSLIMATTSDESGNYLVTAPETGDYEVVVSKSGFDDERQWISMPDPGEYTLDFIGEHGLVPKEPDAWYVIGCISHWLYPEPPCGLPLSKVLHVVNNWQYPPVVKLGIGLPLSGYYAASIGLPAKQALELAADNIGWFTVGGEGYRWNLIFEDNSYSCAGGTASANEFIYEHDVDFMHQMGAEPGFCAAQITEEVGVILDTAGDSPFHYHSGKPHTFQGFPSWHLGVVTFFDWLAKEHPEVKRVAIAVPDDGTGHAVADAADKAAEYYGFEVVAAEYYAAGITEYYPMATKIMAADPDIVLACVEILDCMWDMGYEGLAGTHYWTEASADEAGWDRCQGYLITMPHPFGGLWLEAEAMAAEYEARYGVELTPAAFWAANMLFLYTSALMQAGTVEDVDTIIETLETGTFDSMVGPIYYGLEALNGVGHVAVWPSPIYEVVGEDEYRVIDVYTPEEAEAITVSALGFHPPPPPLPGVGSTWEYLVDYEDEIDHPFTTTLVQKGVSPKSDYTCVPVAPQVTCNLYETDTHADGACPPNPTKPKRPLSGFTMIPMSVQQWENAADGTTVGIFAPICMTAPLPLGRVNGEGTMADYTAVSGTVGRPYALGDKWTYAYSSNAEILGDCVGETAQYFHTVEVVAVDVSVTVPAGTFTDCVEMIETQEGATGSITTWWSPTVQGMVRSVDDMSYAPGVETWELASYNLK